LAQVRASGGPAIDPATREAVEKIVAGLKDEANRLTAAGKKDEAEQKMQSIRAIEQLLNAPRRAGLVVWRPGIPDGPAAEEMKRLHERIGSLRAQAERQPQDGEAHEKMQKEMAELHRKLAELHRGQIFAHPGGLMPGMPGQPGMPVPFGGFPAGGVAAAAPGQHFALQHGGIPAEVQALNQKSAALMQAAAQLQQAGLEEQARDLRKQAEKLQAAAEKIRAEAQPAPGAGGPGGFGVFGGGPPMELQKTIRELQEQIQQLRKEIGELRELLQQPGSGEERRREPRPRER
jgi:DNA repair exonuclease SbcCD ATPase subunit